MCLNYIIKQILNTIRYIWTHPANRGGRCQSMYRAIKWQIIKRLGCSFIDIKIFNGLQLRCYSDSKIASSVIYCNGYPDYHEMHFMRRYLRPSDVFLDVGANIGIYSLLAASFVGVNGRVISFEPGLKAHQRLVENITLNEFRNVTVYPSAVGNKSGYVDFLIDIDETNRIQTKADFDISTVKVPSVRLDDVIQCECALAKVDTEGAELLVLQGAEELLKNANPPVWLLELNGSLHDFNFSEREFVAWLASHRYSLCFFDADRLELNFADPRPWLKSPNVLAVADDRRFWVGERCGAPFVYQKTRAFLKLFRAYFLSIYFFADFSGFKLTWRPLFSFLI